MKKCLSLKKKVLLSDGLMGIIWLLLGMVKYFELVNPIKNIVLAIILIAIVVSIGSMFCLSDKEDEMAKENMLKAESNTYKALKYFILLALIFTMGNKGLALNVNVLIPLFFGSILLVKTFSFVYYEKVGE